MTDRQQDLLFIDADNRPGITSRTDSIISWTVPPERPLYCALLEGYDAERTLRRWITNPQSELALQNTQLMVASDRVAGGFTGFSGRQLRRRRETDLIDLVRRAKRPRCPRLRRRLKDLMPLYAPVAANDFYLSKIGLCPRANTDELGPALVDASIRRARNGGFDHIRTDVDADRCELIPILSDSGFQIRHRGQAPDAGITYLNMALKL